MPPLAAPSIHNIIVFQSNKKWNLSHAISKISNKVRISKWFSLASCLRKMRFLQEGQFSPFSSSFASSHPCLPPKPPKAKNIIIQARHTHVPFPNVVVPTRERKEKRKYFVRKRPANFVFLFLPPKHDFAKRRRKNFFTSLPPFFVLLMNIQFAFSMRCENCKVVFLLDPMLYFSSAIIAEIAELKKHKSWGFPNARRIYKFESAFNLFFWVT